MSSTATSAAVDASVGEQQKPARKPLPFYVMGLSFPPAVMWPLAETLCEPDELDGYSTPHEAVVYRWRRKGFKQTIISLVNPETNKPYYLWVMAWIPPDPNGRPLLGLKLPMSHARGILNNLKRKGLAQKYIQVFRIHTVQWPKGVVRTCLRTPHWLPVN